MLIDNFLRKLKRYHFELRHITLLLTVLIIFQLVLYISQNKSLHEFLDKTQNWYQQDSAERLANLTTTSLELLVENVLHIKQLTEYEEKKIIQSFNIIFSQQLLQKNVNNIFIIIPNGNKITVLGNGSDFYNFLRERTEQISQAGSQHLNAIKLYKENSAAIRAREQVFTLVSDEQSFHIFVPFVPNGEFIGVLYMENKPNLSFITEEIKQSYDSASLIYSSLILLGLIAVYFISSHTVKERNKSQKQLFDEKSKHIKEEIEHEKESLFTKRIYHTHHKAEKVMGFIKEDLRKLTPENSEEIKTRVSKYASFISRVIYDMKWYDPPVNTIRNTAFKTNINSVIDFIVKYIFLRISSQSEMFEVNMELDDSVPVVFINEFVIWEIIEPLIQNSIDHSPGIKVNISISTKYFKELNLTKLKISDDGKGINESLLEKDEFGIKKIFHENISTVTDSDDNRGYGAYIAYEISKRCGWFIDAHNLTPKGCVFELTIPN
ncbi:MAG: ATP-binding protein [Melioribacteraceae bacterium]|nr:ATP-binding protein [Melioribacteraceae bacterium]MCF8353297.1 ATP-binding protein [Melioribacteraceae bacterium]MCF8395412.1 ATP-binding protein [Melioribacteraceae bacterium]MCF8418824.1 ATP-binding protein [Melioribacteraceae bacterium]